MYTLPHALASQMEEVILRHESGLESPKDFCALHGNRRTSIWDSEVWGSLGHSQGIGEGWGQW